MATRVVNVRREPCDVYIGRPSRWGNPFVVGQDGTRDEVITKYEQWLEEPEQAGLRGAVGSLQGLTLGCYCAPKACHGDVLARLADRV